jgi:prevent-host-death family protein
MIDVAVRELRNHTADVIKRVAGGEQVMLTSNGIRIARIEPVSAHKRAFLAPVDVLGVPQADAGLRADLAAMGDQATDTVGPLL